MSKMTERRVLITGVSRGVGRAMLSKFADLGHTVIGCARSRTAVSEISAQYKRPHQFEVVDISDNEQVAAWATAIIEEGGPPDLLLNNAGVINENNVLWETPPEEFSRVVDVNIKGVFHVVRHFVPAMIERKVGVVVNFSSGWGRSTSPEVAAYCGTKWAVEGLSRAMADAMPRGMATIALNPGVIHTDMLETCWAEKAAAFPSPEEWAQSAVPFLLDLGPGDNGKPLSAPA